MPVMTTYTQARANFARFCNRAGDNREVIIVHRRGARDVAMIAAEELEGLLETAHLLRSPRNARRLLTALRRARKKSLRGSSLEDLRRRIGLKG